MKSAATEPISVSVKEAAALVGCAPKTIYELANKGEIASRYLGRKVLILYGPLKAYVEGLPLDPPEAS